jgi:GT2 family glycosyltransferase
LAQPKAVPGRATAHSCPDDLFATPPMFWSPTEVAGGEPTALAMQRRLAHVPFAFWLVDALRPARLVTIGNPSDPFHLALREAVERLQLSTECLTVAGLQAADMIAGDIDLLTVAADARPDHTPIGDATWDDWLAKLGRRGVVVIAGDAGAGAVPDGRRFRFEHAGGLDILLIGTDVPEPIIRLVALTNEPVQSARIRARFARLGEGWVAAAQVADLSRALRQATCRAEATEAEAAGVRQRLKEAHASAIESDLARRKVKRLNKTITRSWIWMLVKPFWLLERRLRGAAGSHSDNAPRYGIAKRDYQRWIAAYDRLSRDDRTAIQDHIARLGAPGERPLISLVMPVYNTDTDHLAAAIASVRAQIYPDWQLCIADDASPRPEIASLLAAAAAADSRIRVVHRPANGGIVAASNSALELAEGLFVAFLDHDDVLAPHALYMVAALIVEHPDAELIYSDEDHLDADGRRHTPHFKSDWNPDLILAQNYVCHFAAFRTTRVRELGGLRPGFDGSQDWDLVLRVTGAVAADRIHHIPHVLYHWRNHPEHEQFSQARRAEAEARGRRAVLDHLAARGIEAQVTATVSGYNHVRLFLPDPPPPVSLIVPTRDRVDLLRACLDGVLQRTLYPDIEVIVVDNNSSEPATLDYLAAIAADPRVRVLPYPGPFNFSGINNAAVAASRGEVLCLLNNDIEVIGADWLTEMVAQALRPEVGAVGARLLYANSRVQHGGCILGIQGSVAHAHVLLAREDPGYFGRARLTQNLSAVTGACLVTRRSCYDEVGGLDADNLAVTYNDIDFCLKLRERGYLLVYAAQAELFHHESMSRGHDHISAEKRDRQGREAEWMRQRWGDRLRVDPYYNPNLSLDEAFTVAFPPRAIKPWRRRAPA